MEPKKFLDAVLDAESDDETVEQLMCGAAKYLKLNRARPDAAIYVGLMHLAMEKPHFFAGSDTTTEVLLFKDSQGILPLWPGLGNWYRLVYSV